MEAQKAQRLSWQSETGVIVLLWVLFWNLSMLMVASPYESIWFPASGISVLALLVSGWRAALGIAIAIILTTLFSMLLFSIETSTKAFLQSTSGFIFCHLLAYSVFTFLFRFALQSKYGRACMVKPQAPIFFVVTFTLMSFAGTFTNAWLNTELLLVMGYLQEAESQKVFWSWALGDAAGILVIAPVCLGFLGTIWPHIRHYLVGMSFQEHLFDRGAIMAKIIFTLFLLLIALGIHYVSGSTYTAYLVYLPLFPLLWIGLTESSWMVAATLAALTFVMSILIDSFGVPGDELVYQGAIILMALLIWLLIAVRTSVLRLGALKTVKA